MASDTDLIKLYSARILALAADIPHLAGWTRRRPRSRNARRCAARP